MRHMKICVKLRLIFLRCAMQMSLGVVRLRTLQANWVYIFSLASSFSYQNGTQDLAETKQNQTATTNAHYVDCV